MSYLKAVVALIKGLDYCLRNRSVRKLAMWPWLIGSFFYVVTLVGGYHLHPIILDWMLAEPEGFWRNLLYGLAWLGVGLALLIASMLITITLVMIFTSVFQINIATTVLLQLNREVPFQPEGVSGMLKETSRSIAVESFKLIWLLPLLALVFVIGFIPLLTPFALLLGAWVLAYEFVDIILDIYLLKGGARLRFALHHGPLLICFGLVLACLWAIPFVGLLLPPAAVAGAAWLLSETELLDNLEQWRPDQSKSRPPPTSTKTQ